MENKFLFLFTITPVQSFINQARKAQDLYAGSFMLSHFSKAAANKLKMEFDCEIIFPDIANNSIPNRFAAVVNVNENEAQAVGDSLQKAVEAEIKRIGDSVINGLKINKPNGFDEQLSSYFTVSYLFVPYNEDDYKQCYSELESLMGAIKSVRAFSQYPDSERGRKCSICGERNVKFYRMAENEKDIERIKKLKLFSNDVYAVKNSDYRELGPRYLQAGEGLCGVCFTKRGLDRAGIPEYKAKFPSTSKIALFDAFKQLREKRGDFGTIIDSDNYEPQGIFALKNNKNLDDFPEISEMEKKNTRELYEAMEDYKISYSPYYAVMLFDGDSMGEWLSGNKIKDEKLKEFHKELTKKLGEFANAVRDTIKEPLGVTVYAGGEDFLGFFSIKYLLEGMKHLRNKFNELVNLPLKDFYADNTYNMTFSAGAVIAHIKTPLSEVLNWARKVEQEAKDIDDTKDAFAIAVLKHSGEIEKTVFKWRVNDTYTTDLMSKIVTEINNDRLSNTFIKKLNQELIKLLDKDGNYRDDNIIKAEIKRLLMRSFMKTKDEDEDAFKKRKAETAKELQLHNLLIYSNGVRNFLNFLNITDFIARQAKGGAA
ncbi:type III-B CRISPR-associated protein Cas10/Cmr2 [hot springs metagenome]|uniref:Type III-B CRISPR-associated protein Cas10/Cmr2 n=1 Tax=hot springs metagenome TaxID=433727 RepID=A0A5J4L280_9ZZZZ